MDEDLVRKICDAVRDTAEANAISDTQLHAIVDAVVGEVRTNIEAYIDDVCRRRWF